MIAAMHDLPADAIAYYGATDYLILISHALPYSVKEFLVNQLLGLICGDTPMALEIPTGQGALMMAAPLAEVG